MSTTLSQNNVESIASTLVEKCRQFKFEEVIKEFYASDIVSIESMDMPEYPKEIQGLQAVIEKGQRWANNTEVHQMKVSEPLVAGSQFVVRFEMDVTCKQTNERNTMQELALYHVENGKIVREQFFYDVCQQS